MIYVIKFLLTRARRRRVIVVDLCVCVSVCLSRRLRQEHLSLVEIYHNMLVTLTRPGIRCVIMNRMYLAYTLRVIANFLAETLFNNKIIKFHND